MRFKIASVQGEGGEQGVTLVTLTVLAQDKVILHLPYSSLLKGNTLVRIQSTELMSSMSDKNSFTLRNRMAPLSVSLILPPHPQHSEEEMTLLYYSITVGIQLKDNFFHRFTDTLNPPKYRLFRCESTLSFLLRDST